MAYAVIGGLVVATLLTLVFLPALYVAWFRVPTPSVNALSSDPDSHSDLTPIIAASQSISASFEPALQEG
jgi:hypothetical protein